MPRKFDFAKECKKESKALLQELKKIALNPSLRKPSVKLAAINQMLDRAYGKPRETVDVKQGPRIIEVVHAPGMVPGSSPASAKLPNKGNLSTDTTEPSTVSREESVN